MLPGWAATGSGRGRPSGWPDGVTAASVWPSSFTGPPGWADALYREPADRWLPWVPDARLRNATLAEMQVVCGRCLVASEGADYSASHSRATGVFAGTHLTVRRRYP
jgi:hypothetical protein